MKYPILYALLTGLFWGLYGPVLAQSRGLLHSPFKPYVAIGVAYLVWGILGGLIGMAVKGDAFDFGGAGMMWGLVAGTLGAWGALTLTLAMFTGGGKIPQVVMPIVFGGAVTVSALAAVWSTRGRVPTSPWLWVGIIGMGVCIVIVAYHTPHAAPSHAALAADPADATTVTMPRIPLDGPD
jgi:hypothetical protein